jgi:hypothetical protein
VRRLLLLLLAATGCGVGYGTLHSRSLGAPAGCVLLDSSCGLDACSNHLRCGGAESWESYRLWSITSELRVGPIVTRDRHGDAALGGTYQGSLELMWSRLTVAVGYLHDWTGELSYGGPYLQVGYLGRFWHAGVAGVLGTLRDQDLDEDAAGLRLAAGFDLLVPGLIPFGDRGRTDLLLRLEITGTASAEGASGAAHRSAGLTAQAVILF